ALGACRFAVRDRGWEAVGRGNVPVPGGGVARTARRVHERRTRRGALRAVRPAAHLLSRPADRGLADRRLGVFRAGWVGRPYPRGPLGLASVCRDRRSRRMVRTVRSGGGRRPAMSKFFGHALLAVAALVLLSAQSPETGMSLEERIGVADFVGVVHVDA